MSESYYSFEMFCSLLNNQNILKKMPALVVQGNLESCVTNIKSDVLKDLLKLDNYKINVYLDLKLNKIKKQDYLKGFSSKKIERWLEYFKVELDDILAFNVDSDSFQDLVGGYYLNHNIESVDDDKIEDYKIAKESQVDFLYYFLNYYANQLVTFLESKKVNELNINRDFISKDFNEDQLLFNNDQSGKKNEKIKKNNNSNLKTYNRYIFKSKEAETWFNNTLEELGAIDENKKKAKGLQAKADALFKNLKCKDNIFKYNLLLKTYISFLNKEYRAKIKSDSRLSDGGYHQDKIQELISSYLNK